jgi:integrase
MKLTAKAVAGLVLPDGKSDHIVFDERIPGFGLRLRKGGTATWIFQYALGRARQYRMVIGKASAVTAEKAREIAADHHATVKKGGNPAVQKAENRAAAALSLKSIADRYLAHQKTELRPRSYTEIERHLVAHAKPLHGLPIGAIDRKIIAARLNDIANKSGAVTANRVRATFSAMFTWALKEGLAESNPVAFTNQRTERPRDRTLSDQEIKIIWSALGADQYSDIIRLLTLTAQRRNEIAGLQKSEIDFDKELILLPADRVKNGHPHQIPMSPPVSSILQARVSTAKDQECIFGVGEGGFKGWSKAKRELDARITKRNGKPLDNWTLHDLRRTAATRMGEIGVLPHVVESLLNHYSGYRRGVAKIYNLALYAPEKAQALALWANHVSAVVEGKASNVTWLKWA